MRQRMRQRKRRNLTSQLQLAFPREQNGPMRFWQRRFYDFNMYSRGKVKEKLKLHACESGGEEVGETSQGLAMEQLEFL
jgi:hypothetical protein